MYHMGRLSSCWNQPARNSVQPIHLYSGVQIFIRNKSGYIIALICTIIITSCVPLLHFLPKGYSQLWSRFILTNLQKRKGKSKRDGNSPDLQSTDAQTESQKEVTFPRALSDWQVVLASELLPSNLRVLALE